MRLEKLLLRGVGPFREATFEFAQTDLADLAEVHLFVGPNGSGKSTLLYSIASCLGAGFAQQGQEAVSRRMWSDSSRIGGEVDGVKVTIAKRGVLASSESTKPAPDELRVESGPHLDRKFSKTPPWLVVHDVLQFGGAGMRTFKTGFLPAFAYSGARTIERHDIRNVLAMPTNDNPLDNSLDFGRGTQSQAFAQWLAVAFTQEALALKEGKREDARTFTQAIERVTQALSDLVGRTLRIRMTYDPFDLQLDDGHRPVQIDLLPDGVKSILSWLGDLVMRLDKIQWPQPLPTTERPFILLLDEIDIHLHPEWQWKVLPLIRRLFPNAQVFASTHSPFVVSSVDGARIHPLRMDANGEAAPSDPVVARSGTSFLSVVREIFGIQQEFYLESQGLLGDFYQARDEVLKGQVALKSLGGKLSARSEELRHIVMAELAQVARVSEARK